MKKVMLMVLRTLVALDALQIHLDAHVAEQLALEEALAQSRTAIKVSNSCSLCSMRNRGSQPLTKKREKETKTQNIPTSGSNTLITREHTLLSTRRSGINYRRWIMIYGC